MTDKLRVIEPEREEHCAKCSKECTNHYFMCDEAQPNPDNTDPVVCPECFPTTPCGRGEHGEGCPTQVVG